MAYHSLAMLPGDLLTIALPDGQSLEVDLRSPNEITVWQINTAGDACDSLNVEPEPDTDPHPSLSAAERNPSLCR